MVGFDRSQRRLLAETVRDIANIAAGALVFGQLVAGGTFSLRLAILGGSVWIAFVGYAVFMAKGSES